MTRTNTLASGVGDELDRAKTQLTLKHPFIASLLLRRELRVTTDIPTACIDARGTISLNPEFIAGLSNHELQFLLAHECLHHALSHVLRCKHRDHERWNIACDAVINETLVAAGIGEFIAGGVRMPGADGMSAEQVYEELQQDPDKAQSQGSGQGIGDDLDHASAKGMGETEKDEVMAEAARELVEARSAAKMCGNLPGGLARLVESALKSHAPWQDVLADFIQSKAKSDYSWSRPSRRHIAAGMYLPGHDHTPAMGPIVIAIDTSCSVSDTELAEYQAHVTAIVQTCRPEKVTVVYCDTDVRGVDEFAPHDEISFHNMAGGGGTSFYPVFEWVDQQGAEPDMLVYFTDMMAAFPEAPGYPVAWVTATSDITAPFGKTILARAN